MIEQPQRLQDWRFLACARPSACRLLGRMELPQHDSSRANSNVPFSGTFYTGEQSDAINRKPIVSRRERPVARIGDMSAIRSDLHVTLTAIQVPTEVAFSL